ncbi:exocyst complex component 1-like isoform X2 [Ornithorhynchus anatinus]|uniref:exocyst complex component 1-like isoform X2 n=1 Tax=Ornithorhynchus anatinus TaxID=9258 RepID=UPI0010A8E7D9|nr:exocyst complex component 1-like isoform X2 [Ornithorhynchus anatinus]
MASTWNVLQGDVFTPSGEKLLEIAHVWKTGKKKKTAVLCIIVGASLPVQLFLVKVRRADRGEQYKRTDKWPLKDLKLVDGKQANQETPEFDLRFDKIYRWTASSSDEKNTLLRCLWKLNRRHLSGRIAFVNVPLESVEGYQRLQEERKADSEFTVPEEETEYQEMTPKESADMLKLMEEYEPLVSNSVAFVERLSRDLQLLDEQVAQLVGFIDEALEEVADVEETLQIYEKLLGTMKQQMDHIQRRNSFLQLIDTNQEKLMNEILFLVDKLNLSTKHYEALSSGDLSTPKKVKACSAAVGALTSCMNVQIQPAYRKLQAVAEQLIKFETLRQNFENGFVSHIVNIFEQQGRGHVSWVMRPERKLIVPSHGDRHRDLLLFVPLMTWLKNTNPALFQDLPKVYTRNLSKLYERQIRLFFERARMLLERPKESSHEGLDKLANSPANDPSPPRRSSLADSVDGEGEESDRGNMGKILERILRELEPLYTAEQTFITKFFLPNQDGHQEILDPNEVNLASLAASRHTRTTPQLDESIIQMLKEIFASLESELKNFIGACQRVHQFSFLQILVTLNDYSSDARATPSTSSSAFFVSVLSQILYQARSTFGNRVASLCKEIEDAKVSGKMRLGVLPFISRFEEFVTVSEDAFKSTKRREDLDRAHGKLIGLVFKSIDKLSSTNLKINADMVKMENFHHIHCFLSQMKIQILEDRRKEAKKRYSEHLDRYVIKYLGQPLEKLNCFFDGVKTRLAQGVKEEEVSFQLAYSKQELRKVIEKYPGKEVKRSLEVLYKKIIKHLSPEENLLPLVWHAMEKEVLQQYHEFDHLIHRCYQGSGIALDFSVEDLLEYFETITQSNL